MASAKNLSQLLVKHALSYAPVIPHNLNTDSLYIFDLSDTNSELQLTNLESTASFHEYIFGTMAKAGTPVAIGRYNENRIIYKRSSHFQKEEARTFHLGIDLWSEAGTPVFTPLPGRVHSFRNNIGFGDYGPTIILEHSLENTVFFTLYGHLSAQSLRGLYKTRFFEQGTKIGEIGPFPENGDWPPHLHFQVITDMLTHEGDFPGVASLSTLPYYLELCPNPNLILKIQKLMHFD